MRRGFLWTKNKQEGHGGPLAKMVTQHRKGLKWALEGGLASCCPDKAADKLEICPSTPIITASSTLCSLRNGFTQICVAIIVEKGKALPGPSQLCR